tara:strand:- start:908 stop:1135 length:228 start_codon:yes stop_codon:yes gene_type:complete
MKYFKKVIARQKEEAKVASIKNTKESIIFQLFNDFSTVESIEIFNEISSRFNLELRNRSRDNTEENEEIREFLTK